MNFQKITHELKTPLHAYDFDSKSQAHTSGALNTSLQGTFGRSHCLIQGDQIVADTLITILGFINCAFPDFLFYGAPKCFPQCRDVD
jgi:hypothetical protein